MKRARRLASVAVVASLAMIGLSACRSSPQVAAYVGNDKITEDRVDAVLADAKAKPASASQPVTVQRQDVVNTLVGLDALDTLAKRAGVTGQPIPADQVASAVGLQPAAEYVTLTARYHGLFSALTANTKPGTPTEADLRDVYNRLTQGGANPTNQSYAAFRGGISSADVQTLAQNVALRDQLQPQLQKLHTVVNPRYQAPELTLVSTQTTAGQAVPLVVITFVKPSGDPTVVDVAS